MQKNRIKSYWLLLLVMLLVCSIVMSSGISYARYVTTATSVAVMETPVKILPATAW